MKFLDKINAVKSEIALAMEVLATLVFTVVFSKAMFF